jgi:hypothetical protein
MASLLGSVNIITRAYSHDLDGIAYDAGWALFPFLVLLAFV